MMDKEHLPKIVLGIIGFFVIIVLYANELSWYNNTFDRNSLIITALILGVLIGLAIGYRLQKPERETIATFQIYMAAIVLSALLMPFVLSLSNRVLSFRGITEEPVEFVRNEAYNANRFGKIPQENPDGYYSFVIRKGTVVRLHTEQPVYENATRGTTVVLPVKKGLLGYDIAYPHLLLK